MALDRDSILSRRELHREEIQVPEWGGSAFVRMMTGAERDRFDSLHANYKDVLRDFRARVLVFTVCDAEGNLLFTEADIPGLGALPSNALNRLMAAAVRINKFSEAEVEELRKNS